MPRAWRCWSGSPARSPTMSGWSRRSTTSRGFAHSLSLSDPLRLRKIGERHYAVRGTPTDCVIMGCSKIMPDTARPRPVRRQFRLQHRRRRDLFRHHRRRHGRHDARHPLARAEPGLQCAQRRARRALGDRRGAGAGAARPADRDRSADAASFLNVNFPNCAPEDVPGTIVTTQGKLTHGLWVEERADGRGFPYYWLRFGREKAADVVEGSDMAALRDRKVSVTPLKLDLTAHESDGRAGEGAGMNGHARRSRRLCRLPAAPARQGHRRPGNSSLRSRRRRAASFLPSSGNRPPGRIAWCRSNAARRSRASICRRR